MALRWFLALSLVSSLFLPVTAAKAQTLDQYGGYADLPALQGGTGYFRVEQINGRWTFVTPEGHVFWMRSVYAVGPYNLTFPDKYPDVKAWGVQANRRLKAWGFNAVGEYASPAALPVGAYGGTYTNPEKLPFIRLIRPSQFALDNRWGVADHPVIDLISSVDPIHKIYRGGSFPDVYSLSFEQTVDAIANDRKKGTWAPIFPQGLATSPWLIGTAPDDADFLYGFKRGWTEHLGWMVAVANPTPQSANVGGIYKFVTYTDPRFYTKEAWRDRLVAKYGTIAALNAAWGASYTTFGSDGGWPLGKGLMDESGRNSWMQPVVRTVGGVTANFLGVSNPVIQAELDAMMEQVADKYFSLIAKYIRQFTPNHLVFGPATLHDAKPEILRAAARHLDVLQVVVSAYPAGNLANLEAFLDRITPHFPKPIFLWTTFTSQANSPFAGKPNNWGEFDKPTQEARGQGYADYLGRVLAYTTQASLKPIVGIDWWSWTDHPGEGTNFGLVTLTDNAYDGKEAVIALGTDAWGYRTGGEVNNYGNFLSQVVSANAGVAAAIGASACGPGGCTPTSTTVSITSPKSGSIVMQTVNVSAVASSSAVRIDLALDGRLTGIFNGTAVSYPWDTTASPNGTHRWVAKAYDSSGASVTSSPVDVTVSNTSPLDTTPPVVSIPQPTDGSSVVPDTKTTIQAAASDNVGVTRVEFYVNGSLKCSVIVGPYACQWQVPAPSPASPTAVYRLQAKAYDARGNVGSSSIVTVQAQ